MIESQPMGLMDRLKTAGQVLLTGKPANPLANEPADKSRAALVRELEDWWKSTKEFWQPTYDLMREEMRFAAGKHWSQVNQNSEDEPYKADIVQRHLAAKEASLYAKRPTFTAERRKRLQYTVWDGDQASLDGARMLLQQFGPMIQQAQQAQMALQEAGELVPPAIAGELQNAANAVPPEAVMAQAIVKDFEDGQKRDKLLDKVGETLALLFDQELDEQQPNFEQQMKQLVTRVNTVRVGYVKLLYRRGGDQPATESARGDDLKDRAKALQAKLMEMESPDYKVDDATAAEVEMLARNLQVSMQKQGGADPGGQEGLVFDFLPATSVVVDKGCRSLRGFVGCDRIAHEMHMTLDRVREEYGVELCDTGAVAYHEGKAEDEAAGLLTLEAGGKNNKSDKGQAKVCVVTIYDRKAGLEYVICHGVKDFLREPEPPWPELDRFWPIFPLTFRPVEIEENDPAEDVTCYPRSDVRLLMPMQREKNRSREALREHRMANRPLYIAAKGRLKPDEKTRLRTHPPSGVVEIELNPGEKVSDVLQAMQHAPIDPAVYSDEHVIQDTMQVVGTQEANLGPTSNATATEASIAEGSRLSSVASNADDVDTLLDELAESSAQVLFTEKRAEDVKRKVGPGAVWPDLSAADIRDQIYLKIKAGSAGKPNKELEVQNFERMAPLLVQMLQAEGKSLAPMIQEGAKRLDDKLDVNDFNQPAPMLLPQGGQGQGGEGAEGQGSAPAGLRPGMSAPNTAPAMPGAPANMQRQAAASAGVKPGVG